MNSSMPRKTLLWSLVSLGCGLLVACASSTTAQVDDPVARAAQMERCAKAAKRFAPRPGTYSVEVRGMAPSTSDERLRIAFEGFGNVKEAKVLTDRDSGASCEIGFVSYADQSSVEAAIGALNNLELGGRVITVKEVGAP